MISCLVTAYRRSTFLDSALQSIARQSADPSQFEVVLLHNIEHAEELVERNLVSATPAIETRLVPCDTREVGPFFRRGIEECRGDIICFLNDDDFWFPGKLEAVRAAFSLSRSVGFFRHGFEYVDANGRPLPHMVRRWNRRHGNLSGRNATRQVLVEEPVTATGLRGIARLAPQSNETTMAIRKDCVTPQFDRLDRINAAEDFFFFYSALASGRSLLIEPSPLSALRIHGQNVSAKVRTGVKVRASFRPLPAHLASMHVITEVARSSNNPDIANLALHQERQITAISHLVDNLSSRTSALKDALSLVPFSLESSTLQDAALLLLGLLKVLSPTASERIYGASL